MREEMKGLGKPQSAASTESTVPSRIPEFCPEPQQPDNLTCIFITGSPVHGRMTT